MSIWHCRSTCSRVGGGNERALCVGITGRYKEESLRIQYLLEASSQFVIKCGRGTPTFPQESRYVDLYSLLIWVISRAVCPVRLPCSFIHVLSYVPFFWGTTGLCSTSSFCKSILVHLTSHYDIVLVKMWPAVIVVPSVYLSFEIVRVSAVYIWLPQKKGR